MRILLIHNYYQQKGGEDSVFEAESKLLQQSGQTVKTLIFHNNSIQSWSSKLGAGMGCIFNVFAFFKTFQEILRFSPDVIHAHNIFPLASPSVLFAAKLLNTPVVMTIHNYRMVCANAVLFRHNEICQRCINKNWALDALRFKCYQGSYIGTAFLVLMQTIHKLFGTWHHCVAKYIALSEYEKKILVYSSVSLKTEIITVKPHFALPPAQLIADKKSKYFTFIGRLSIEKGILPLVEAFQDTDLPLKIIGTGPLESTILTKIAGSSNIELLGFMEKTDIYEHLQNSIALVFPSVLPETFGLSIIEAFSARVPVITTNIGGPAEIVQDSLNGLHVSPGSSIELQLSARKLLENPILQKELAENAYQSYVKHYSASSNYQQLIGIYRDVIKKQHIA